MSFAQKYFEIYEELEHLGDDRANVALAIFQESCKNDRVANMIQNGVVFSNMARVSRNFKSSMNGPASEKQIYWLKKAGVNVKGGLTKAEASRMIDELKK